MYKAKEVYTSRKEGEKEERRGGHREDKKRSMRHLHLHYRSQPFRQPPAKKRGPKRP